MKIFRPPVPITELSYRHIEQCIFIFAYMVNNYLFYLKTKHLRKNKFTVAFQNFNYMNITAYFKLIKNNTTILCSGAFVLEKNKTTRYCNRIY